MEGFCGIAVGMVCSIRRFKHETRTKFHTHRSSKLEARLNAYTVSCVPWIAFTHFSVHNYENKPYYFPSVEAGRFTKEKDRFLMPLSITCHHATTDGYHVNRFLEELQTEMNEFEKYLNGFK